jgi:hypothetical protein
LKTTWPGTAPLLRSVLEILGLDHVLPLSVEVISTFADRL